MWSVRLKRVTIGADAAPEGSIDPVDEILASQEHVEPDFLDLVAALPSTRVCAFLIPLLDLLEAANLRTTYVRRMMAVRVA